MLIFFHFLQHSWCPDIFERSVYYYYKIFMFPSFHTSDTLEQADRCNLCLLTITILRNSLCLHC